MPRALLTPLVLLLLATPAHGEAPRFGLSGLFDIAPGDWATLDDDVRVSFVSARARLAGELGADLVRWGSGAPEVFSMSALQGFFPWIFLDRVVGALSEQPVEVVVTLSQLVPASQRTAYRQFVERVAMRYDGTTDFGIHGADRGTEYPDIDGSGAITQSDWEASSEAKAAWAAAHRLRLVEIGDRVRAAEDAGVLTAADYAAQLSAAATAFREANDDYRVLLAGTDLDVDTRNRFLDRTDPLDTSGDKRWFDAAGAHLLQRAGALDPQLAMTTLDNFTNWLADADHAGSRAWLTELAVASGPAGSGPGPCNDARCSERTQANLLAKLTLHALSRGYTTLLYAAPIDSGYVGGTGLLVLEQGGALEPRLADLRPRPAWAVWRALPDIVGAGPVTRVGALPANVEGVAVPSGWVLWFNWVREVGPGQPYDSNRRKEVVLRDLSTSHVRVVSLWPESVGARLDAGGGAGAVWTERLLPVRADGTVIITVEQDVLWVVPEDAGPVADDPEGADTSDQAEVAEPPASGDKGGCVAGPGSGGALFALALVLIVTSRRRRPRGRRI